MQNHKWLHLELEKWLQEGLISKEQQIALQERYPLVSFQSTQVILFFASLLIGLGIILLVAANWEEIPRLVRLGLILIVMLLCYASGYYLAYQQGNYPKLGQALLFLGLLSYGAGIWLVGQMYHLSSYNATGLGLWFLGAALMANILRQNLFFVLSIIMLVSANLLDADAHETSIVSGLMFYAVYGVLILPYLYKNRTIWNWLMTSAALGIVVLAQCIEYEISLLWLLLFPMGAALLEKWEERQGREPLLSKSVFLIGVFLLQLIFMLSGEVGVENGSFFPIVWLFMAALLLYVWGRERLPEAAAYLLIASPLGYIFILDDDALWDKPAEVAIILCLFIGSLLLIQSGSKFKNPFQINTGIVFFLICVLYAYSRYAWGLFDKSLFFIGGGVVLLALGTFLERKRRSILRELGGDGK